MTIKITSKYRSDNYTAIRFNSGWAFSNDETGSHLSLGGAVGGTVLGSISMLLAAAIKINGNRLIVVA